MMPEGEPPQDSTSLPDTCPEGRSRAIDRARVEGGIRRDYARTWPDKKGRERVMTPPTGDHKGPPIHLPSSLAPTDNWAILRDVNALEARWNNDERISGEESAGDAGS